jgi:hypothetical protein
MSILLMLSLRFRLENRFDRLLEDRSKTEGEGEAGLVFPGFDRVDRLPGHTGFFRDVALGPSAFGPQHP